MISVLNRSKNIPIPDRLGLVSTLRGLEVGESVTIPESKKSSVHPAARRAGVRVTVRTIGDGTVRVWRIPTQSEVSTSVFDGGLSQPNNPENIFGESSTPKATPAGAGSAAVASDATAIDLRSPDPQPKAKRSGYCQVDRWSPRIWVDDLDAFATTKDTIFS